MGDPEAEPSTWDSLERAKQLNSGERTVTPRSAETFDIVDKTLERSSKVARDIDVTTSAAQTRSKTKSDPKTTPTPDSDPDVQPDPPTEAAPTDDGAGANQVVVHLCE